jgi:SAM-dependent methyltransferase
MVESPHRLPRAPDWKLLHSRTKSESHRDGRMMSYTKAFFDREQPGSTRSAEEIVPIIVDLVAPLSVVDVGCGRGDWLKSFRDRGVSELHGIDGEYAKNETFVLPLDVFEACDLEAPPPSSRTFDLVICLEVAEHLHPQYADGLVDFLTSLGSIVLFSAAIPFQGGIHHYNEQWQGYWAAKFVKRGYLPLDVLRPKIWNNSRVEYWYAQNTLLYVDKGKLESSPSLREANELSKGLPLSVIHPRFFDLSTRVRGASLYELLQGAGSVVRSLLRRREADA